MKRLWPWALTPMRWSSLTSSGGNLNGLGSPPSRSPGTPNSRLTSQLKSRPAGMPVTCRVASASHAGGAARKVTSSKVWPACRTWRRAAAPGETTPLTWMVRLGGGSNPSAAT